MLRFLLNAILFLLGLLAAAAILTWLIGRVVSDRYVWSQWLLWIPTPAALLAACLGLLCAARPARRHRVRRRRRLIWLNITLLLAGYFALFEHHLLSLPSTRPGGLKLVHWNLGKAREEPEGPFAGRIVALDGDVTILTNAVRVPYTEEVRDWLGEERRPVRIGPFVVLTRLAMLQWRWLVIHEDIVIVMLELDATEMIGRPVTLYLVDLPSNPRLGRADIARKVRAFLDETEDEAPPPDVVVGDFNITRGSAALSMAMPGLRHAFDDAGHGYGASFHQALPLYHIDHVLLAPTLRCTRYDLIDPGLGRHRAQAAWLVDTVTRASR